MININRWPIDLIEKKGFTISSIKYKIFNEGKQIINKITIAITIQIIPILWFFNKNKFENLFKKISLKWYK